MFSAKMLFRAFLYAAAFIVAMGVHQAQAQPAESNFCVVGTKPKQLYEPAIRSYDLHNEIVMARYGEVLNSFKIADMRDVRNAGAMVLQLGEAKTVTHNIDRKMWGVVIEPPAFVDLSRSCERLSNTNTTFVDGEYPIIFNTHTPRIIGEMCVEEPVIRFDVSRYSLQGVNIELGDFYDPSYSSDHPFRYEELEREANLNQRLPAFIRALMGIRMAQCDDLPASMTFVAESEDKPIMTASLLFLDHGIRATTRQPSASWRRGRGHGLRNSSPHGLNEALTGKNERPSVQQS